jgi:hypothetical protein
VTVPRPGAPQQQMAMVEFDAGANPWEDAPMVTARGSPFTHNAAWPLAKSW